MAHPSLVRSKTLKVKVVNTSAAFLTASATLRSGKNWPLYVHKRSTNYSRISPADTAPGDANVASMVLGDVFEGEKVT